jgi:acetate kinase
VCEGLEFLGVHLGPAADAANASVISDGSKPEAVMVIPADEEIMIGRTVYDVVGGRTQGPTGNRP